MIYIIDKSSTDNSHVMFNASMLSVLEVVFPNISMRFLADSKHQQYVLKTLKGNNLNIDFQPISVIINQEKGLIPRIKRIMMDFTFLIRLFTNLKNPKTDIVIFLSIPPFSFVILKYIKILFPNTKVLCTMHGELEWTFYPVNKLEKFLGSVYKHAFNVNSKNFYYLLLSHLSKNILTDKKLLSESETLAISHPYLFQEIEENLEVEAQICVQLAHVGALLPRKNGAMLYELASLLKESILIGKLNLFQIGGIDPEIRKNSNNLVKDFLNGKNDAYIDRTKFENQIQKMDYSIFFYEGDQFLFRASGAVFDVIQFTKPIIALKSRYFEDLFNKYGNIGYLCDNLQHMAETIENIDKNSSQYQEQIKNLSLLKSQLTISEVAKDFKIQFYEKIQNT